MMHFSILAEILETKLFKDQEALEKYKALLIDYPSSLYGHEARKRVRVLRGETITQALNFSNYLGISLVNDGIPVMSIPVISKCMSCVPS